ncbi:MAG TPA: hypothetical protein VK157_08945, partial [Phycisphaerales bacterium]|nr:hypothetical protein [Phycisphaerales bacterium]
MRASHGVGMAFLGTCIAAAQPCEVTWLPGLPTPGAVGNEGNVVAWDPDGAGPLAPSLVVGGGISWAGGVSIGG